MILAQFPGAIGDVLGGTYPSFSQMHPTSFSYPAMGQRSPYTLPGYDAQSSEIVFSGFPNPLHLSSDEELRLWYWEDLIDQSEQDNGGTSCADVFAKYL